MFKRTLTPSLSRSFFLFGPRSTGKSTLLEKLLPPSQALWLDLLDPDLEQLLAKSPSKLSSMLDLELNQKSPRQWVVIDEVQKVPALLSVVHKYIQKKRFRFALTGSSARKLKREGADLLAGRASWFELYSLNHLELAERFDLQEVLNWGSLPEIFELKSADRTRFLRSYCHLYLKEEIVAEQLVRKVQPFRNFLELVANQNSQIVNYSHFARDCGVDVVTIQTYFEILQDTLIGFELPPFHQSVRKRQRKNPKFFFFDTGVSRALSGSLEDVVRPQTGLFGRYFEAFLISEIYKLSKAFEKDWSFSYLTTKDDAEIDLIIDTGREAGRKTRWAIEIKSYTEVSEKEVRAFERLAQDVEGAKGIFLSQDPRPQQYGQVQCLHWKDGLKKIFSLVEKP